MTRVWKVIGLAACAVLVAAGCGQGGEARTSGKATEDDEPKAVRQDLCAKLDAATMTKIADVLGGRATEYKGNATSIIHFPTSDQCVLPIADAGTEARLTLAVLPMTKRQYERNKKDSLEEWDNGYKPEYDVNGVGDAAYFGQTQQGILVGDRYLSVSATDRAQWRKIAKLVVPVVADLPPAPRKVTLPACDEIEAGALEALGEKSPVRRDESGEHGLSHCAWVTHDQTLEVTVGNDTKLRKLARTDESHSYARKDGHYYQLEYHTVEGATDKERKTAVENFLVGLENG